MIKTFRDKSSEEIFEGNVVRSFGFEIQKAIFRKLRMLNRVSSLYTLHQIPSNRLKKLKGTRRNQYSIRVNDQYRICFLWMDNDAYNVEVVDYH